MTEVEPSDDALLAAARVGDAQALEQLLAGVDLQCQATDSADGHALLFGRDLDAQPVRGDPPPVQVGRGKVVRARADRSRHHVERRGTPVLPARHASGLIEHEIVPTEARTTPHFSD